MCPQMLHLRAIFITIEENDLKNWQDSQHILQNELIADESTGRFLLPV